MKATANCAPPVRFNDANDFYQGTWTNGKIGGGYGEFIQVQVDEAGNPIGCRRIVAGEFHNGVLNGLGYVIDHKGDWYFGSYKDGDEVDGIFGHQRYPEKNFDYLGHFN